MNTTEPEPTMKITITTAAFQGSYAMDARHLAELQAWLTQRMQPKRRRKEKEAVS